MGSQLAAGLGSDGFNLLVHGVTRSCRYRYQLDAGAAAGCATGNCVGTECTRPGSDCFYYIEIAPTLACISTGATGLPGLWLHPVVPDHRPLDQEYVGDPSHALVVLDAGLQQHVVVALDIHHPERRQKEVQGPVVPGLFPVTAPDPGNMGNML